MTDKPKRKKHPAYGAMTMKFLKEKLGYRAEVVERYMPFHGKSANPRAGFRRDMFQFADIVAMKRKTGIVAVQSTGQTGHSSHKRKILECEDALYWLECGGRIMLMSWKKKQNVLKDGSLGKGYRWKPRI